MRWNRTSIKPPTQNEKSVVGIAWFNKEQWLILKATAADEQGLHDTYEDWLISATQAFNQMRKTGLDMRQVDVDVAELAEWCRKKGLPNTGASRAEYVTRKLNGTL